MRIVQAGSLMLLLGTAPAMTAANNPLVVWQGGLTIVTVTTPACDGVATVGEIATAIFRPRLDPAEPASALSVITQRTAGFYQRAGGTGTDKMGGSGSYKGMFVNERAGILQNFTGSFNFSLSPADPLSTTNFTSLQGTITNFTGATGCAVTVRGSFALRP